MRLINKWIEKRFNEKSEQLCLVPTYKNICEKYKTSNIIETIVKNTQ